MKPSDLSVNKSGFATRKEPGKPGRLAELANVDGPEPWRIKQWMLEHDLVWARFRRPLMFTVNPETESRDVPRPWLVKVWALRSEIRYQLFMLRIRTSSLLERAAKALLP
jgi:hypothetical protein